ncbi:CHAT domain-containing protein [Neolewinella agarilytica]|uniref:CHAT domain-containing protein n=1 Tax=Neolewinella agarilytica TaxID=478744 RepID=A0A1H9H9Q4_9BACT|nr:CHAT domain-containing protein [Neolewinella agarilytica]SEQ59074.1 CHAT domain-containing protein [Neolewinella agarilytica]
MQTTLLLVLLFSCQPNTLSVESFAELKQDLRANQLSGNDTERRQLLAQTDALSGQSTNDRACLTLYQAENAYENLAYEKAMQLGREALSLLKQSTDDDINADLYRLASLLTKLHFEHWQYTDSIVHYAQLAQAVRQQLPAARSLDLDLALLKVLELRVDYHFPEIEALVDSLKLPDNEATTQLHDTKAQLYLFQARAIRKQRFNLKSKTEIEQLFARSLSAVERAISQYQQQTSPRLPQAFAENAMHKAMLGTDEEFKDACQQMEASLRPEYPLRYGFTARLKAMRLTRNPESIAEATNYYREIYPQIQPFNVLLKDEADYFLEESAKQQKDYAALWEIAAAYLTNGRCASLDVLIPKTLTEQIPETIVCLNNLIDLATAKWIEYEQTGSLEALELADQYIGFVLANWSARQSNLSNSSLLYQLSAFGTEGLEIGVVSSIDQYRLAPAYAKALDVLQRMDAAKSLLMRRDLLKRDQQMDLPRYLLQDSLLTLQKRINVVETLQQLAPEAQQTALANQRQGLLNDRQQLEEQISTLNDNGKVGLLLNTSPPPASQLREESLLMYSWLGGKLFALALTEAGEKVVELDTTGISGNIKALRAILDVAVPDHQTIESYRSLAHRLYQQLFQSIAIILPPGQPLLVIPDGPLSTLPFEALLTEQPSTLTDRDELPFLLHRHRIRYASSWAVDQIHKNKKPFSVQNLSVAVVAHSGLAAYFQPTHDSLKMHAAQYQEHIGGTSPQRLQALATPANILHFSAHAKSNPDRLQDNYIYLSRNDKFDAASIESLNLTNKLVVLAACETRLGQQRAGEGNFTISRSFRLAGAQHVVSSLWQVKGPPTKELLEEFYRQLFAGQSPAEALWRAKVKMASGMGTKKYWWAGSWAGVVG